MTQPERSTVRACVWEGGKVMSEKSSQKDPKMANDAQLDSRAPKPPARPAAPSSAESQGAKAEKAKPTAR